MLLESLKMAIASLLANKMRALLTMLGIIVGISSVIAIVSLGEGGKNEVLGQFDQIGGSTVMIRVNSSQAQDKDYITQADIQAIRERTDLIKYVTASVQTIASAVSDDRQSRVYLAAIDEDYTRFTEIDVIHGRLFTEIEYTDGHPVTVIDRTGALTMFGRENAVGESLTLISGGKLTRTTVIGVCESITSQMSSMMDMYGPEMGDVQIPFLSILLIRPYSVFWAKATGFPRLTSCRHPLKLPMTRRRRPFVSWRCGTEIMTGMSIAARTWRRYLSRSTMSLIS